MTGSEGRWAKGRMGEEEEGMRGGGVEGGQRGGGGVKADFGVKSSLVGNYQSLRNAAAALTRQAAAWLQRLRSTPTCITPSTDLCVVHARTKRL